MARIARSSISPAKPMMAFSGVRSSWLMMARNADLASSLRLRLLRALLQRDLVEALLQPRKRFQRVQGLEEIVEGTAAERFDGVLDLGPRGDDDAEYIGEGFLERRNQGETVLAPEVDVDDRDLWDECFGSAFRTGDRVGDGSVVAAACKNLLQRLGEVDVVVDDEHASVRDLLAITATRHRS